MSKMHSVYRIVVLLVAVSYGLLFCSLQSLPFLDLPNHLTRALILSSIFFDEQSPFSSLFGFEWLFNTYLLGDGLLIALLQVFSFQKTGIIFIAISFFLYPISVVLYAKEKGLSILSQWILTACLLFLSANWFFLSGFLNYQFSLSLGFFTLFLFERLVKKPELTRWFYFSALIVLTYFMHLASFVLCGAIVAISLLISLLKKSISLGKVIQILLPFVLVSLMHIVASHGSGDQVSMLETFEFRSWQNKIAAIASMFYRFNLLADAGLCLVFTIVLLAPLYWLKVALKDRPQVLIEYLIISAMVFCIYIVLPVAMLRAYDVDNRALPYFFTFLLLASLTVFDAIPVKDRAKATYVMQFASFLLCVGDMLYLWSYLPKEDTRSVAYESLIAELPRGCRVLPVATVPDVGRIQNSLHLGSYYTAQGLGYTPYLFSRTESHPQTYFYYKDRVYAPDIFWYLRNVAVQWPRVMSQYDLLIVTKPFDKSRFLPEIIQAPVVAENDMAVAFKISDNCLADSSF